MKKLSTRLVDKSIEAFIMGIEIYNKPTIKYRIEGFSFFIVNSWELMLKAELLNRKIELYYSDNPDRTLSINDTIKKIYSDKNTRIRINLEKIIELRNISTHYITEDYEYKYAPLFQACVLNYVSELQRFHSVDISESISQNFLTISASYEPLSNEQIKLKYPPQIAEKLIQQSNEIEVLSETFNSDKFSINIKQNLYITKKHGEADFSVSINKNSNSSVEIIKDLKDPSDTHKYSYANVVIAVSEKLNKQHIKIDNNKGFTNSVLTSIINFYDIKSNIKYAYKHTIGKQEHYTYSQQFIDFIVTEIKKNPTTFVAGLKQ